MIWNRWQYNYMLIRLYMIILENINKNPKRISNLINK